MAHLNSRIFVCADPHIDHAKIIGYEPGQRPFRSVKEHNECIFDNWSSTVRNKDTVIILGDIHFGPPEGLKVFKKLKGIKKLVLGNHDNRPISQYGQYFSKVAGSLVIHKVLLTHLPTHPCNLERWRGNIHGHLHTEQLPDPRYECVSLEQTGYAPVLLDDVISWIPERDENEDS